MQDVHLGKQRLIFVTLPQSAGGLPASFGFRGFGFLLVLRGPLCRVVGIRLKASLAADAEMYSAKAARRTFDEITNPASRQ